MGRAEHRADPPVQRAHDRVGEAREGLPGLLRGHRAGQDARADQEYLLLAEQADAVEEILMGAGLRQRNRKGRLELLRSRQGAEKSLVGERVHHLGMLGERIGEPRRGAEHAGDEGHEVGVLPQQREQPRPAMQIAEEAVEGDERGIGIFGARDVIDQDRHELGEHGAGRRRP